VANLLAFNRMICEKLKIGAEMELVIEKMKKDLEGNEVVTYKFRPL
jgi:hypothetical protein